MGKKLLKGKFLLLGTTLLLFGACKAENRETTKLDETFAHFLDEQKNSATDEAKMEMDAANIVTSEETAMKKAEPAPLEQKKSDVSVETTKQMDKGTTSAVDVDLEKKAKEKESKKPKKPAPSPSKK